MKRELSMNEDRINGILAKNMKAHGDIENVRAEIREGFFILKLFTNFPTNPVICLSLMPDRISSTGKDYSIQFQIRELYVESPEGSRQESFLTKENLDRFVEAQLGQIEFLRKQGDVILMEVGKETELGAMAELAPDLVEKAIRTSRILCRFRELVIETEISDWDIKSALLKNPAAISSFFANGGGMKGFMDRFR